MNTNDKMNKKSGYNVSYMGYMTVSRRWFII